MSDGVGAVQATIAVIVAGLLVNAGAFKLLNPRPVTSTMSDVLRVRIDPLFGRLLGVIEVVAGIASATFLWAFALLIPLGVAFAWAGLVGMRREQPIPCHCFEGSRAPLGWRQLLVGAVLVLFAATILGHSRAADRETRLLMLCFALLVSVGLTAVGYARVRKLAIRRNVLVARTSRG